MNIVLIVIVIVLFLSYNQNTKQVSVKVMDHHPVENEEVIQTIPSGFEKKHNYKEYKGTPLPKIPYKNNKDLIAPPKVVVDIRCPTCPDTWE